MQSVPAHEDSIRRLLDEQIAAWNAGDAAAWCKDHTPDAAFVNILGMYFRGRDANMHRHAELFAGIFKGSRLALREVSIRVFENPTATADAVLDLSGFSRLPPGIRPSIGNDLLRTRMHYMLIHEAGRWQIILSQDTAVMPMPPAG